CTGSADVVSESIEGKSPAEASKLTSEDVLTVLQTDVRPTRLRCVTLPLTGLPPRLLPIPGPDGQWTPTRVSAPRALQPEAACGGGGNGPVLPEEPRQRTP